MKRVRTLVILIILLILGYFILDKKLSYYGKNDFKIYSSLPFKIRPVFRNDFEGGFVLRDNEGFAIAGRGVSVGKIGDTAFQLDIIHKVLKYGFDDENLVVLIMDTAKNNLYIEYLRDYKNKSNPNIKVKRKNDRLDFVVKRWINVENNKHIRVIELCRNYSFIINIFIVAYMLYIVYKKLFTKKL